MGSMDWEELEGVEMDLHTASALGCIDVVQAHILRGEHVNGRNKNQWTPLMYACAFNNLKIVEYLLCCGASKLLLNNKLQSLMMITAIAGNMDIFRYIYTRQLIDCTDFSGQTALLNAIEHDHTDIAMFLIEQGADLNSLNNDKTPLMSAVQTNHFEIVKVLLMFGAKLDISDSKGKQAKDYAEEFILKCLLDVYAIRSIKQILESLGLGTFWDNFQTRNITFNQFLNMTDEDLKNIGINTFGPRRKLLVITSNLKDLLQV